MELLTKRRILVRPRESDEEGKRILEQFLREKVDVTSVEVCTVCDLESDQDEKEALNAVEDFLSDPVLQKVTLLEDRPDVWTIEIGYLPGVTDTLTATAKEAVSAVSKIWRCYLLKGENFNKEQLKNASKNFLFNPVIESIEVRGISGISLQRSDLALEALSRSRQLALTVVELRAIKDWYQQEDVQNQRKLLGLPLDPTDVELEALAQTWSEHCKHKIFNATIDYQEEGSCETIPGLFSHYIRSLTEELSAECPWLVSVFTDNAGIIEFDEESGLRLAFKVETHNSPSALDPYGGALTGILGVNRDILGAGMGARLMANTDVLCFAPSSYKGKLPPRLQHPSRVAEGVRLGIEHGGNKSGVPTVNGSVVFDSCYLGKPLVYCGTVGTLPSVVNQGCSARKEINPGDLAVVVGGRTGRDGIHGATFSSEVLHSESPTSAVQIGDPYTQKKVADLLLVARDRALYRCITDNGAGGLSSSIGELAILSGGCEINLDRVPLKCRDLLPWEILVSESQERMTLAVDPKNLSDLKALAELYEVEIAEVGRFTDSGYFHVLMGKHAVGSLSLKFLHDATPVMNLKGEWKATGEKPYQPVGGDLGEKLKRLLCCDNICSKEDFVRQYDHEVQAGTFGKPFVGVSEDGPADAAVVQPLELLGKGALAAVISHGICPRYSRLDTYHMATCAVDEAVRNAVAVGADPDRIAILDNFCWPDPVGDSLKTAQLVRACKGLYDAAKAFKTPIISGKDSMKNDYHMEGIKISILPTLLISALGRVETKKAVSMEAKQAGDLVFVVGKTRSEMGGSEWALMEGIAGGIVPKVNLKEAQKSYRSLYQAIQLGIVNSCHDCSDGGLAVAFAEVAFSGGLGILIDHTKVPMENKLSEEEILFSETPSRFVVTVSRKNESAFKNLFSDSLTACVGQILEKERFVINSLIDEDLALLKKSWQKRF